VKRFLLDTNILLAYVRGHNKFYDRIEHDLNLSQPGTTVMISVVTKGELLSLGSQNKWGKAKLQQLDETLRAMVVLNISDSNIALLDAYARIDAFSQDRLVGKPLGLTARNMGKNDLWIAATAYVTNATLVTTDGDFDHLSPAFIDVAKYVFG
jgi:tRNA(fMet)-specific endonuclease VapC